MTHEYEATSLRNVPFQYAPGDGHVYRWHWGRYIDVYRASDILTYPGLAVTGPDPGNGLVPVAVERIDVWDYTTGQPRIRRTGQAMATAVEDWRHEQRVAAHPGE